MMSKFIIITIILFFGHSAMAKAFNLHQAVETISSEYQLSPDILASIIAIESSGNACAVSTDAHKTRIVARGLMQLTAPIAQHYKVTNEFDPMQSLVGAAKHLVYLSNIQLEVNAIRLVSMYNAGEDVINTPYISLPSETQHYTKRMVEMLQQAAVFGWRALIPQKINSKCNGH